MQSHWLYDYLTVYAMIWEASFYFSVLIIFSVYPLFWSAIDK